MEFWTGALLGVFVGGTVATLVVGMLAAGKIEDIRRGYDHDDPFRH